MDLLYFSLLLIFCLLFLLFIFLPSSPLFSRLSYPLICSSPFLISFLSMSLFPSPFLLHLPLIPLFPLFPTCQPHLQLVPLYISSSALSPSPLLSPSSFMFQAPLIPLPSFCLSSHFLPPFLYYSSFHFPSPLFLLFPISHFPSSPFLHFFFSPLGYCQPYLQKFRSFFHIYLKNKINN